MQQHRVKLTCKSLVSIAGPVLLIKRRKLCTIGSEVRVFPVASIGMSSQFPLELTTLASIVADTSLSFIGTTLEPETKRSLINGGSTPASMSSLPLLSREERLQRALSAADLSVGLVLPSICTNTPVTDSAARALPSVVKETSARNSAISMRTPSSPETKIGDIHEWCTSLCIMVGGKTARILHNNQFARVQQLPLMSRLKSGCSRPLSAICLTLISQCSRLLRARSASLDALIFSVLLLVIPTRTSIAPLVAPTFSHMTSDFESSNSSAAASSLSADSDLDKHLTAERIRTVSPIATLKCTKQWETCQKNCKHNLDTSCPYCKV